MFAYQISKFPWTGEFKTIEEVEDYFGRDKLTCLICGKEYIALHKHLSKHDISVDDYKERYGIPWRKGLISRTLCEKQAAIMKKQREEGVLPQRPPEDHIKKIQKAARRRRPITKATRDTQQKHGLKMHGRKERWAKKDFEEYLRRIKTGRTITEVGKDKDMPCREVFDTYKRENPDFNEKFKKAWNALPFDVEVRGQKTGKRFKNKVIELRGKNLSWPEIGRVMQVNEGTVRNCWHRLKKKGEV